MLTILKVTTELENKSFTSGLYSYTNEIAKIKYVYFSNGAKIRLGEVFRVIENESIDNCSKIRKQSDKSIQKYLSDKVELLNKYMLID